MLLLDGKKLNQEIASELKEAISVLGEAPHLLIIQIGENDASDIYIQKKIDFGQKIGAIVTVKYFPEDVSEMEIIGFIDSINSNSNYDGIIVQLPLPKVINTDKILKSVAKEKDVDGLADSDFVSATTKGITTLLQRNNIEISGEKVVIINDSDLVGKPTAKEMEKLGAEVIICNKETENIKRISNSADILITAIGQPEIIDESYLKNDQVVVDVGISKTTKGIRGDVKKELITSGDGETVGEIKLKAITPVPGGVGPMTVASLFQNLVEACRDKIKNTDEK